MLALIDSIHFLNSLALSIAAVVAALSLLGLWRVWSGPRPPYVSAISFGVSVGYLGSVGPTVAMFGLDCRCI
jgi:hypothetical protein